MDGDKEKEASEQQKAANVSNAEQDANALKARGDRDIRDSETRERDAELERQRDPVSRTPVGTERVLQQHEQVDRENEQRNEANREGHDRNMARAQTEAEEAQARTAHANDSRANHVPTGKQRDRNTPRVNPDGSKVWDR